MSDLSRAVERNLVSLQSGPAPLSNAEAVQLLIEVIDGVLLSESTRR